MTHPRIVVGDQLSPPEVEQAREALRSGTTALLQEQRDRGYRDELASVRSRAAGLAEKCASQARRIVTLEAENKSLRASLDIHSQRVAQLELASHRPYDPPPQPIERSVTERLETLEVLAMATESRLEALEVGENT